MGLFHIETKNPIRHAQKTARATFPVLRTEKEKESNQRPAFRLLSSSNRHYVGLSGFGIEIAETIKLGE